MQPNNTTGIKPWQWVVTVLVIILLIILGVYMSKQSTTTSGTPTDTNGTAQINNESNRIIIADQYPGNIVYVSTVQLARDGFVVIRGDKNGTPGDILGSAFVPKGIGPVKVTLSASTVNGNTYYATLQNDVDGNKIFSATTDVPLTDSKGVVIMKSFKARTDLPEDKG